MLGTCVNRDYMASDRCLSVRWMTPRSCARRESCADLSSNLQRALLRESSNAPQQRGEVFAVDVLHRKERVPFHLIDVVHGTHVRVRYLPRHAHLAVQLRQASGSRSTSGGRNINATACPSFKSSARYTSPMLPRPSRPDDAIAATDEGAWRESAAIDGVDDESQPLEGDAGRAEWCSVLAARVTPSSASPSRLRSVRQRGQSSTASSRSAAHAGQEGMLVFRDLSVVDRRIAPAARCSIQRGDSTRTLWYNRASLDAPTG
jgi:hypothetical protein